MHASARHECEGALEILPNFVPRKYVWCNKARLNTCMWSLFKHKGVTYFKRHNSVIKKDGKSVANLAVG